MKATKPKKTSVVFLVLLVLFQSCSVYRPTDKTLEELTEIDRKILVETTDQRTFRFKKIINENDQYYGIRRNPEKRTLIFARDIQTVKIKDNKASTFKTLFLTTFGVGLLFLLAIGMDGDIYG